MSNEITNYREPVGSLSKVANSKEERIINMPVDKAQELIFTQLIKIFAYLGHRNIFSKDPKTVRAQVNEISALTLSAIKENPKLRYITPAYLNSIVSKGCSGALQEVKHVSPLGVVNWAIEFTDRFKPQIEKMAKQLEARKLPEDKDVNTLELEVNLEQLKNLFKYMESPIDSPYTDLKQFNGKWITSVLFTKYASYIPGDMPAKYARRKDFYEEAKAQAVTDKAYSKKENLEQRSERLYCYKIYENFKQDFKGDEVSLSMFESFIKDYHNDKAK